MTVIAAVVADGVVYMGADSLMSDDQGLIQSLESKIWRVNRPPSQGDMLLAWTGTQRSAQVARYGFHPPETPDQMDEMAYLCTVFVDALREAHAKAGTLHAGDRARTDVQLLLGWRGRIFVISEYFCVTEYRGFTALGSGGTVANGVLWATKHLGGGERLSVAMLAAQQYAYGVRGPFTFMDSGSG